MDDNEILVQYITKVVKEHKQKNLAKNEDWNEETEQVSNEKVSHGIKSNAKNERRHKLYQFIDDFFSHVKYKK